MKTPSDREIQIERKEAERSLLKEGDSKSVFRTGFITGLAFICRINKQVRCFCGCHCSTTVDEDHGIKVGGKMFYQKSITVWTDGEDVIVPCQTEFDLADEIEGDEGHSCDEMGCSQEHVVARFKYPRGVKKLTC